MDSRAPKGFAPMITPCLLAQRPLFLAQSRKLHSRLLHLATEWPMSMDASQLSCPFGGTGKSLCLHRAGSKEGLGTALLPPEGSIPQEWCLRIACATSFWYLDLSQPFLYTGAKGFLILVLTSCSY